MRGVRMHPCEWKCDTFRVSFERGHTCAFSQLVSECTEGREAVCFRVHL